MQGAPLHRRHRSRVPEWLIGRKYTAQRTEWCRAPSGRCHRIDSLRSPFGQHCVLSISASLRFRDAAAPDAAQDLHIRGNGLRLPLLAFPRGGRGWGAWVRPFPRGGMAFGRLFWWFPRGGIGYGALLDASASGERPLGCGEGHSPAGEWPSGQTFDVSPVGEGPWKRSGGCYAGFEPLSGASILPYSLLVPALDLTLGSL